MMACLALVAVLSQDAPVEIPKSEWPATAKCVVCDANGTGHGLEKPVAALRYKDKAFFFCNKKEPEEFRKDPEGYMPPVLPRTMPSFELSDLTGKPWTRDAFRDRVVLVDYWATWCKPCKELKPIVEAVKRQFEPKGFEVLSVSIDEKKESLAQFVKKSPFNNPVLFDNMGTWQVWKVRVVPTMFLVKNGEIVAQWSGLVTKAALMEAVSKALGD